LDRNKITDLFEGDGPFIIQPGAAVRELAQALGHLPENKSDPTVGQSAASQGIWWWTVHRVQIPVNIPFGDFFKITGESLTLRFHYRTDTERIWRIGISDGVGVFERAIGLITPTAPIDEAKRLLGAPYAVRWVTDLLYKCIWLGDRLGYIAQFFVGPYRDATRNYTAGDQFGLEVFLRQDAPADYVARVMKGE